MVMANIAIEMSSYPQCSKEFIFLEWLNLYEFIAMIVSNFDNQLKVPLCKRFLLVNLSNFKSKAVLLFLLVLLDEFQFFCSFQTAVHWPFAMSDTSLFISEMFPNLFRNYLLLCSEKKKTKIWWCSKRHFSKPVVFSRFIKNTGWRDMRPTSKTTYPKCYKI